MLIKKFFFSFCWVCVLCTTTQAALPSLYAHDILTAPRTVTAATAKDMACKP